MRRLRAPATTRAVICCPLAFTIHLARRTPDRGARRRRIAAALPANVTITAIARITGNKHRRNRNLRIENGAADPWREQSARGETHEAADQRQQRGFRKKNRRHREPPRAQRLHQSNFRATFKNRRSHRRRNRQRRGKQRRQRYSEKSGPSMRVSTAPSFCATWRICSACEWGIASCN